LGHPNTIEIIEHVKRKGLICDMSNNFSLVTKERAERLVKAGMDHMNVSMWAGSEASYLATHPNQGPKDWARVTEMLSYLASIKKREGKRKPVVHLYHVISTRNYWDFDNMIELSYKVGADGTDFTPTDIVPGKTDSLMLSREQADWLIKKVERRPN